jgi:hypothetical protein
LSGSDVPHDEMSDANERFDRALGDPPFPPEDEIGAFVHDVREAFPAEPMLAREAHLEAVADAARRLPTEGRSPTPRKESRVRFPRLRSRAAMIVAGLVVAMSSFGGLAVAGALPGGVQDGVANVAANIGVDLPGGDDESSDIADATDTESPEPEETETPEPSETEAPAADDQGEDEQSGDQGQDEQSGDQGDQQDAESGDQGDQQDAESGDQGQDEQSGDQGQDEQSGDQGDQQDAESGDQGDQQDAESGDQGGGDSSND